MGTYIYSVLKEKTKKSHIYLVMFSVEKDGYRHYDNIKVNVRAKGVRLALEKAQKIALEYADNNYGDDYRLRLLRWGRYTHKPNSINKVIKRPMIRVK